MFSLPITKYKRVLTGGKSNSTMKENHFIFQVNGCPKFNPFQVMFLDSEVCRRVHDACCSLLYDISVYRTSCLNTAGRSPKQHLTTKTAVFGEVIARLFLHYYAHLLCRISSTKVLQWISSFEYVRTNLIYHVQLRIPQWRKSAFLRSKSISSKCQMTEQMTQESEFMTNVC